MEEEVAHTHNCLLLSACSWGVAAYSSLWPHCLFWWPGPPPAEVLDLSSQELTRDDCEAFKT